MKKRKTSDEIEEHILDRLYSFVDKLESEFKVAIVFNVESIVKTRK